jgi:hypothetical protein
MGRWLVLVALFGLAACVSLDRNDPARELIGVSAARSADAGSEPPDATTQQALDWKVRQICTNGYETATDAIEPAEDGLQLVDRQFRCTPYRVWSIF